MIEVGGVLTACVDDVDSWCLDDEPINLGVNSDLSAVQADYDGDKVEEPVVDELTGLVDSRVQLVIDADGLVLQVNGLDYVALELPTKPGDKAVPTPGARKPTTR